MKAEQDYLTVYVNEPKKVLEFLSQHLDFSDHRQIVKGRINEEVVIAGNKVGDNYCFLSRPITSELKFSQVIVINTDNCLKDYDQLRRAGVKIEQIPKYSKYGLALVISDDNGNRYLVIENRDYSEI